MWNLGSTPGSTLAEFAHWFTLGGNARFHQSETCLSHVRTHHGHVHHTNKHASSTNKTHDEESLCCDSMRHVSRGGVLFFSASTHLPQGRIQDGGRPGGSGGGGVAGGRRTGVGWGGAGWGEFGAGRGGAGALPPSLRNSARLTRTRAEPSWRSTGGGGAPPQNCKF